MSGIYSLNVMSFLILDEELKFLMLKRRCVSIFGNYKVNHKAAHNHFQRYSDVKAKGGSSETEFFLGGGFCLVFWGVFWGVFFH